jgi:PKD repeat protein
MIFVTNIKITIVIMNKHIYIIKTFMAVFAMALFGTASAQYCTSTATSTADSKCDRVVLAGSTSTIDNNTTSTGCATYSDFTSSVAPADLSPGAVYSISITQGTCGGDYTRTANAWIDFNRDQDFNDAGEMLGAGTASSGASGYVHTYNFTVPCNATPGNTRMRIIVVEGTATNPCLTYTWGETEDYTVTLLSASGGLSSNFFAPTTAFVGTPVTFTNSNQSGYISHKWTVSAGPTSYTTNATHVFNTAGTYTVKLVSENCLGKDSTTKSITIVTPTAPPVANFVSNKNVVDIFEQVELIDLSTNGATYWDWMLINHVTNDTIDGDDQTALRGDYNNGSNRPQVATGNYFGAVDVGVWEVCLRSSNVIGASAPYCKVGYITVQRTSFNMGPGTSLPANTITATSGTIFDNGGPSGNYTSPQANLEALIAPCGASSVSLDFSSFALNANANLKIYDGVNALGTPLHSGSGFTAGNAPSGTITANSGTMYLLFNSTTGTNATGFEASWTSVAGTGAAPVAGIALPGTTVYNSVFVDFLNTSTNAEGNTAFEWTISGPGGTATYNTRNIFNEIFTTNGTYTISLDVTSCDGQTSSTTKTFNVVLPTSPTELDFTADNRRPSTGDNVTLTATSDKANRWEWNVFPQTGYSLVSAAGKEAVYKFTAAGAYTVQLRGFNTKDTAASEATVVRTAYIIVVQHCSPTISVTASTDVAISYVSLEDASTGDKFVNESTTGVEYSDFTSLGTLELNYGGVYNFEVKRNTNINAMTRKIWADWNVDGDFDDAGETIAAETTPGNSLSWKGSFAVPASAFEANTLIRVGVSYDNDPNEPCGASLNAAANRVGEFEDYAIRVVNDGDAPVITLVGMDTTYVEQNAMPAYSTPGATAMDPSQGDITADLVMTTDLDQTLPGIYYEDWNVADASGNAAPQVTRVIYVVSDQTAPVLTINGSADTTIEVGSTWIDLGATAIDNKEGDISNAIIITDNVNANVLGDYTVTYDIADNQGNASSAIRNVHVIDDVKPVVVNESADKSGACWSVNVQLQFVFADVTTASDNYNDLANGLTLVANPASPQGGAAVDTRFQGTTNVIYTATDESGNSSSQCIDYIVRDFVAPVIDLRTLDVITHPVGSKYTPVAPTATDNLYGTTEISLIGSSNVNGYVLGTYQDTYTATDAAGNVSTKVRTVHVTDEVSPKITGKNGGVIRLGVGSDVNMMDLILFSDNYDAPSVLEANTKILYNDVNLWVNGFYSVVFVTEDNSGNISNEYTLYVDCQYHYEVIAGVNDINLDNMISVYPNPTQGNLVINTNLAENEVLNLNVYNAMGQEVAAVVNGKVTNGAYSLNIADQANGVYYIKMMINGDVVTKKVILNK